jgi:O-antigen/teichoic acid export membrane protein
MPCHSQCVVGPDQTGQSNSIRAAVPDGQSLGASTRLLSVEYVRLKFMRRADPAEDGSTGLSLTKRCDLEPRLFRSSPQGGVPALTVFRETGGHGRGQDDGSVTAAGGNLAREGQPCAISPDRRACRSSDGRGTCGAVYYGQARPASCPLLAGAGTPTQQKAGIAALIGIAIHTSIVMSEASTVILPTIPGWVPPSAATGDPTPHPGPRPPPTDSGGPRGRLRMLATRLRTDHLVRNSLYLMLSAGVQAAMGFAFWVLMARLYSTEAVGQASSLISAITLIAFFALFGLNSTLVRYLPTAADRDALITAALLLVAACGAGAGMLYVLLTPVVAPRLAFVEHRPALAAGFTLLAAAAAVNVLTDSVFVASRRAGYCALTDGGVSGASKIISGVILAGSGAYGLFSASAGGFAAAALASLALMATALHWRPSLKRSFRALKPLLRFSGGNYAANIMILVPTLVVPIIVLDRLGASAAAYYFVAFQIATLLYSAVYAVEQAFLAEGSHAGVDWKETRTRSRRFAVILFLPGCLVLAMAAHWILLAFGLRYSEHGTPTLILLALAVAPIAANNWAWTVLRLAGRLRALVLSCGVYAMAICSLAWFLAPHGLTALAAAWPIGCLLAAAVATIAVAVTPRKAPRHRRTTRTASDPRSRGRQDPIARGFAESE